MTTMVESETTASRLHYCKRLQEFNCDDERRNEKGKEMLFLNLLLIKYGNSKIDDTIKARRSIGVRYTHGTMTDLWKKIDGKVVLTRNITTHLKYVLKHLRTGERVKIKGNDAERNGRRRKCPKRNVATAKCVHWKPSRDFTRPLGSPSGLKGLLSDFREHEFA
ncbi:hypothetical protein Tco_1231447 [Tanacetum coccineum]